MQAHTRSNVTWRLYFNLCPSGALRADGDGLKDTLEAGAANGHTLPYSVKIEEKFETQIIEEVIEIKKLPLSQELLYT